MPIMGLGDLSFILMKSYYEIFKWCTRLQHTLEASAKVMSINSRAASIVTPSLSAYPAVQDRLFIYSSGEPCYGTRWSDNPNLIFQERG